MSSSTGIALSAQSDPFAEVLGSLKRSAAAVGVIQQPLSNVRDFVHVVDTVLDDLNKVPTIMSVVEDVLSAIGALVNVLDAVPFVDAVAAFASTVLNTIKALLKAAMELFDTTVAPIIKACRPIFDDVEKGLTKAQSVVGTIAQKVPDYINTVQILDYMADIAGALVPLLKGTEAGDRLSGLMKTFDDVKVLATKAFTPVAGFLDAITQVVDAVVAVLGSVYDAIKRSAQVAVAGLHQIESIFQPIEHAFNAVANAIKPIRWALDAIAFIFDKVVKPVIDEVLQKTGLQGQLDKVVDAVEKQLGIKAVADLVGGNIKGAAAASWQSAAGGDAAAAAQARWQELEAVLKNYNTRDADGTKKNILLLVNAIMGSAITDGPTPIPEWPDEPQIDGIEGGHRALLLRAAAPAGAGRGGRIATGFTAMARLAGRDAGFVLMARPKPLLLMNLDAMRRLRVADAMSSVAQLQAAAQAAEQSLAGVHTAGPQLLSNLAVFDAARQLPSDFQEETTVLSDLFGYSSELVAFLAGTFGSRLPAVITGLDQPLKAHSQQAAELYRQATGLVAAALPLDAAIAQVAAAMPSDRIFAEAINFIDAAASGSKTLAASITEAQALDRQLGGKFTARLDAVATQVDASAAAAGKRLGDVSRFAGTALSQVQAINQFLSEYGAKFSAMSADAQLISAKALPDLKKGTQLVGVIVSVLDPLSCLLQDAKCVDADDPLKPKGSARAAVDGFKATMNGRFSSQGTEIQSAFGFVLDGLVPLPKLAADVQAINGFVAARMKDLKGQVSALQQSLKSLAVAMAAQPTYPVTVTKTVDGKTTTVTVPVPNVLVDQQFVAAASALFKDIDAAARAAGVIPATGGRSG